MAGLAGEIFQGITLIKMAAAMTVVLGLTTVAERVSPTLAGLLSGFPLGAALSLFFFAVEISPEFAAQSAIYTILGLIANMAFIFGYHAAMNRLATRVRWLGIFGASTAGLVAYFAAAAATRWIPASLALVLPLTLAAILISDRVLASTFSRRIQNRIRVTWGVLVIRAAVSSAMVVAITIAAKTIGPGWAGLFSAFPVSLFPLMLMIHASYGSEPVRGIIKNIPRGLASIVIYCLVVIPSYPRLGILWGTLAAYAAAASYQVFIIFRRRV